MLEVHHLNNSRSQRVLWLLEELGAPYSIIHYQRDARTMAAPPELRTVHPLGKSPVIRDGDKVVAESAAILEYLVEHYGYGRFVPARFSAASEQYRYWMHYAEGSLMPPLLVRLYLTRAGDGARPLIDRVDANLRMHLGFIDQALKKQAYVAGDEFTAADIQLSFPVELIAAQGMLSDTHANVRCWLRALHGRPAYRRALEKGGPYAYTKD